MQASWWTDGLSNAWTVRAGELARFWLRSGEGHNLLHHGYGNLFEMCFRNFQS